MLQRRGKKNKKNKKKIRKLFLKNFLEKIKCGKNEI